MNPGTKRTKNENKEQIVLQREKRILLQKCIKREAKKRVFWCMAIWENQRDIFQIWFPLNAMKSTTKAHALFRLWAVITAQCRIDVKVTGRIT